MKRPKIAYVTTYNALDGLNFSGLGTQIARVLEKFVGKVGFVGDLRTVYSPPTIAKIVFYKYLAQQEFQIERKQVLRRYEISKNYARQVEKKLKEAKYDFVFSPSTIPIAFLETNLPIIFWADATFEQMLNYYFFDVSEEVIAAGNKIEQAALDRAKLAIYSSTWALKSANEVYKAPLSKLRELPFGTGISLPSSNAKVVRDFHTPLNLLFMGKEWERKGGSIAYDAFIELEKLGVEANLTIIGQNPEKLLKHPRLTAYSYLDRNIDAEMQIMTSSYENADFCILPSRSDCSPLVFSEANRYGLPIISTKTGGIPSSVKDGINGFTLPVHYSGKDFALFIKELISNVDYPALRKSTRNYYKTHLDWDVIGNQLNGLITEFL